MEAVRPLHWIKSGFCFSAVFFSGNAGSLEAWVQVLPVGVAFSILASAGYLLNDVVNREEDRLHPRKRDRPVASGAIAPSAALVVAGGLALAGLAVILGAYGVSPVMWVGLVYLATTTLYSLVLRRIAVLDVMILAGGFVLRVLAGAYALAVIHPEVHPTPWLIVCTYSLALLLGFGKRRAEWLVVSEAGSRIGATRMALAGYSLRLLDFLLGATAFLSGFSYLLYCLTRDRVQFLLTALPVVVGLMSYMRMAARSSEVELPERLLLHNVILFGCVVAWLLMVALL